MIIQLVWMLRQFRIPIWQEEEVISSGFSKYENDVENASITFGSSIIDEIS